MKQRFGRRMKRFGLSEISKMKEPAVDTKPDKQENQFERLQRISSSIGQVSSTP